MTGWSNELSQETLYLSWNSVSTTQNYLDQYPLVDKKMIRNGLEIEQY